MRNDFNFVILSRFLDFGIVSLISMRYVIFSMKCLTEKCLLLTNILLKSLFMYTHINAKFYPLSSHLFQNIIRLIALPFIFCSVLNNIYFLSPHTIFILFEFLFFVDMLKWSHVECPWYQISYLAYNMNK